MPSVIEPPVGGLGFAAREQVVHGGAARIGDADHDVRLRLAQIGGRAGDGAAGADRADEAVHLALRLLPDFRAGRDVVRLAVVEIVPLVGEQHPVGLALAQLVRQPPADVLIIVGIAVRNRRHLHQLGAAQAQRVLLLLALGLGDDDQRAIAAGVGDHGEADAGVAGRAFDHQAAGLELAALLRLQDHLAPGAVLHRLARVHELGLAQDGAAGRFRGALELDQRGVSDRFDDVVANLHARTRCSMCRPSRRGAPTGQGELSM